MVLQLRLQVAVRTSGVWRWLAVLVAALLMVGTAAAAASPSTPSTFHAYDAASGTSKPTSDVRLDRIAVEALDNAPTADSARAVSAAPAVFVAAETASSFGTSADQAVFWSGLGRNGESIAASYASKAGGTTLEQTAGAAGLPAYDASNAASVAAWRGASESFARGASGNVRVVLGNSSPESIWNTVELPALQANTAVTSITAVDPATGSTSLLWSR
jgi:hypothetical protein